MSEFAPKTPEIDRSSPENRVEHASEARKESHESNHEQSKENKAESLKHLRHEVEHLASSKNEMKVDKPTHSKPTHTMVTKQLKKETLSRTINKIQKQLTPAQRTFSKVVHNSAVDKVSNVGEKTVARPYGILGGGVLALLGSIFSTYLAKQFGLPFNLLAFIVLFAIGYLVTTTVEMLVKLIRAKAK